MQDANDVYSSVYPLFWFGRLMGLVPVSLNTLSPFGSSIKSILYCLLFLSLNIVFFVTFNISEGENRFTLGSKLTRIIFNIREYVDTTITVIFILTSCLNHRKILLFLSSVDYVDRALSSIGVRVSYDLPLKLFKIQLILSTVFIVIPCVALCVYIGLTTSTYATVLALLIYAIPKTISCWMQSLFLDCMLLHRQRFKIINDEISDIEVDKTDHGILKDYSVFGPLIREKLSPILNGIKDSPSFRSRTKAISSVTPSMGVGEKLNNPKPRPHRNISMLEIDMARTVPANQNPSNKLIEVSERENFASQNPEFAGMSRIRILGHLHDSLCDSAQVLNSSFSFQNLLCSGVCLIDMTVTFYCCFVVLTTLSQRDAFHIQLVFYALYWTFLSMLQTIAVVAACAFTAQEANRSGVYVHNILRETSQANTKKELKEFSLQLLHRKLQFTACDFFPLDFTLLHSMVSAVTTYLVIVIQFHLANKQEN